ncbi:MAG: ABC transporter permease [Candidatus Acidiferrales bacterium]
MISYLRVFASRIRGLFTAGRDDQEFERELEIHLAMLTEENVRRGMAPGEARRAARIRLGGSAGLREGHHDLRVARVVETFSQDVRHGLRLLRKSPGFTTVAVLTLVLGIGANTAVFSVVNAVLLEPLPYRDSGKLDFVWSTMISQGIPISGSSAPDFREWRARNQVFTDVAAWSYGDFDIAVQGQEPMRLKGAAITAALFPLLGVNPALGRTFLPEEEQWGRHHVVLLSYGLWQSRFAGDPKILGRTIHLDGEDETIVGVMPRGMPFFDDLPPVDVWAPLAYAPKDEMNTRGNHYLQVVARLKPGVTIGQAQADVSDIAKQLETEYPENKGLGGKVVPVREQLVGDVQPALIILLGAVSFVLLIACLNVANLMLARATSREQEFAVRSALGASRGRLLRLLVAESIPITLLSGIGGVLVAAWAIKLLTALMPSNLPRFNPVGIDGHVLMFTAAASLVTATLFSLIPAVHVSKTDVQESLREGARGGNENRGRRRTRNLLVVVEVALALLLLVGAGLLIETLSALRRADAGFASAHVLTMQVPLSSADFPHGHEDQSLQFFNDLEQRVRALPGVKDAGITTTLPLGFGSGWGKYVDVQGHTPPTSIDQVPVVRFQMSSPGYMPAIGARLRKGRFFSDQDDQRGAAVAIINETFERQFFSNENPVGKSIRMLPPLNLLPAGSPLDQFAPLRTVVAVIADMKDTSMSQPALPTVFAPYAQYKNEGWDPAPMLVVQTTGDALAAASAVRDQVHALLADQPVAELATMDQLRARSLSQTRFIMLLLSIFAGIALVLAAVGIYGVMAYTAVQRTHEIGIRMALGAEPKDVMGLVLKLGTKLALAGVAIGTIAAFGLTRLMSSLLYGVSATDPVTFIAVAVLLGLVAVASCFIPARRVMRVDPMIALRYE